jgi:DNA repair exonuclease SbcCD ATPase subunit
MRIATLEIANFRSYGRSKFALGRARTYVLGHNNAGKSTLIDALMWGLSGRCRGLDGSSREITELVREEQTTGLGVKIEIEGFGLVQRQTNGRDVFLKVKDWSGSNRAQQEQMFETLKLTEPILSACLDAEAFLRLHHADAKALVMGVMDVRIPAEPLSPYDIAGPLSLEELERHYKRAFDDRTVAKRKLDDQVIAPAPNADDEPPPIAELEASLAEVREEEKDLLQEGAEARGKLTAFLRHRDQLAGSRDAITERLKHYGDPHAELDKLEAELAKHKAAEPGEFTPPAAAVDQVDEATVKAEEEEASGIRIKLADDRGRLRMIGGTIDKIEAHDPSKGCVLDAGIACPVPSADFKKHVAGIRKQIKALERTTKDADARLQWLEAEASTRRNNTAAEREREKRARADHDQAVKSWRARTSEIERKISSAKASILSLQQDQERLAEVLQDLAKVNTEIENLGDDAKEPDGLEQLRERIKRGEQIIAEARAWHDAKIRHDQDEIRAEKYRAEVARLEELCDKLGPKGLILDALEGARATFEGKVNAALQKWGYRLEFFFDPWTVRVNGRKSTQLSKSERLRVGISLQLAIAEITGLWLAAIDEVDMLDAEQRGVLEDVIDGWQGQIILAATKDPGFELPDDLPDGVALYWLELREKVTHVSAA